MIFSSKTVQILSKLSSLDDSYEMSLNYLHRQSYVQEHNFSKQNFKYVLKNKVGQKPLNNALYSLWYGLLLLKSSSVPLKKSNTKVSVNDLSLSSQENIKDFLINLQIEACLLETLRNGGIIELIYGIERELISLGIDLNDFFNAIRLNKWIVKPHITSSPSDFNSPLVIGNSKWKVLIKNFLSIDYFVKRETFQLIKKVDDELKNESLETNLHISQNLATSLVISFPFYVHLSYLKENPFFFIKDKLNFEDLFSILLLTQENFAKSDAEYCLQELKLKNWENFLVITTEYIKTRYPHLLIEFFYGLVKKPTMLFSTPQNSKKLNSPIGIWTSITSYQKLRKHYVIVYQSLTTIEEKMELEKAFETVANHLQYNIRQSIFYYFGQKYNSSLIDNSDKRLVVDTELEAFFLQKTLKNYLSDMVY